MDCKVKVLKNILQFLDDDAVISDSFLKDFRKGDCGYSLFKLWRVAVGLNDKNIRARYRTKFRCTEFEQGTVLMDAELYQNLKEDYGDIVDDFVEPNKYRLKEYARKIVAEDVK